MQAQSDINFTVRPYRPADQGACKCLFTDGRLGGRLADDDVGEDIEDIDKHFFKPGGFFWVAELTDAAHAGIVAGMVGVVHHVDGTAEVRRLRVHEEYQRRGIGSTLMETALRFCQESGHLRVILDTYMDREPAIHLFEKFRFRHGRTRTIGERDLLYFYLDLYGESQRQ